MTRSTRATDTPGPDADDFNMTVSALLTTVLALVAPLASAATLPRDVMEVEVRDTTVPVSYATAYLDGQSK
ncbi:hypothetical protein LA080_016143 [Diaporthe eres]|nr:hypothetical protein LA080_016143 [Diaporthe eres]